MMAENKRVSLRLAHVSKSFEKIETDEVTHALNEINLTMESGEFISLVGPSGCGKSTILRLVAGLIQPTTGKLTVDGKTITEPSPERGMVFQKPTLFPWLTVWDNIAFSLRMQGRLKGNKDKVERMIKVIGLEKFRNDYPGQLSGGMAQRVALVRSLINEPDILLLDEPTTFLDISYQVEILDLLTELNRKRRTTIIMVLHDINLSARYADYIFAMHNGKLTAQGSPNEVISPELMKEIYGLDCTIIQDPVSKTPLIIPKSRYHR